jgi:hypothetical protein
VAARVSRNLSTNTRLNINDTLNGWRNLFIWGGKEIHGEINKKKV